MSGEGDGRVWGKRVEREGGVLVVCGEGWRGERLLVS